MTLQLKGLFDFKSEFACNNHRFKRLKVLVASITNRKPRKHTS